MRRLTTDFTYTLDNQIRTQVAHNETTGDQTTTYHYGTTLDDSDVARNDLLVEIEYPDSEDDSDVVAYTYNRLGQRKTLTDQRGAVHAYHYDKLGRQDADSISAAGSSSNDVLRIERGYDERGRLKLVTSYDNAVTGSVVNQVQYEYNDFNQLAVESQEAGGTDHDGSPDTLNAPPWQVASTTATTLELVTLPRATDRDCFETRSVRGPTDLGQVELTCH